MLGLCLGLCLIRPEITDQVWFAAEPAASVRRSRCAKTDFNAVQDKVIDAAQRLLDNAVFIRSCIDLSGAPEKPASPESYLLT